MLREIRKLFLFRLLEERVPLSVSQVEKLICGIRLEGAPIRVFRKPHDGRYNHFVSPSRALEMLEDHLGEKGQFKEASYQRFYIRREHKHYLDLVKQKPDSILTFCWYD